MLGPVLLLGALELGLRLAGFGYPTQFFLQTRLNDRPVWIENSRFGWRFFPRRLARAPRPVVLPVDKAAGTCRIFVFGESAAMGDPEPAYGLPHVLATMLRGVFPGKPFEVANVAMTAINSNVLLPIARECVPRQGDVWVIYMGNNEVVGPFGAGTVFSAHVRSRALLQASLALKTTRVGQWLTDLASGLGRRESLPPTWEGMEMFLQQQVPQDDPRLAAVYDHFEQNLRDMLAAARRGGVKVIVSTVVSNLRDCAPFGSRHRPDLSAFDLSAWDQQYQNGHRLVDRGDFAAARGALEQAERIDP
ncbi:MAG: hypothetical protein KGS61_20150, partial [Verrucomicrobia bacterium]|nr:hypothetical protein [Verrucomicrobiota bacterium]